jgi:hypothetical protein
LNDISIERAVRRLRTVPARNEKAAPSRRPLYRVDGRIRPSTAAAISENTESIPTHRLGYRIAIRVDDDNARFCFFAPGTMPVWQVGASFVRGEA